MRYKNSPLLFPTREISNEANDYLENHVKLICEQHTKSQQNQSQTEIPATQGQDQASLSTMFVGSGRKRKKFNEYAHMDDVPSVDNEPFAVDAIKMEITNYRRRVHLESGIKDKMKILKWWKDNGSTYPSLYLAVKATLSIPATSIPAKRIFPWLVLY